LHAARATGWVHSRKCRRNAMPGLTVFVLCVQLLVDLTSAEFAAVRCYVWGQESYNYATKFR
jgi:hypothetical protein